MLRLCIGAMFVEEWVGLNLNTAIWEAIADTRVERN
jgi:hypothetical protein